MSMKPIKRLAETPTELHCYRPRRVKSTCDATLETRLRESVRELQRRTEEVTDRIERKYSGRTRVEMVRREIDRESDAEIREALREL